MSGQQRARHLTSAPRASGSVRKATGRVALPSACKWGFTPNWRSRQSRVREAAGRRWRRPRPRGLTPCPRRSAPGPAQDDVGDAEAQNQPLGGRDLAGRRGRPAVRARYGARLAGRRQGARRRPPASRDPVCAACLPRAPRPSGESRRRAPQAVVRPERGPGGRVRRLVLDGPPAAPQSGHGHAGESAEPPRAAGRPVGGPRATAGQAEACGDPRLRHPGRASDGGPQRRFWRLLKASPPPANVVSYVPFF